MSKNTDSFQTISDENHSLRVLITCLITHYLLIEIELSKLQAETSVYHVNMKYIGSSSPKGWSKHGKAYELKQLEKRKSLIKASKLLEK